MVTSISVRICIYVPMSVSLDRSRVSPTWPIHDINANIVWYILQ